MSSFHPTGPNSQQKPLFHRMPAIRRQWLEALLAALLVTVPAVRASAQPGPDSDDEATATADDGAAVGDDSTDDGPPEDSPDDTSMAEKTTEDDNASGSGWGVGGTEVEGRFTPRGKTGRLKKLEEDQQEEEEEEDFTPPDLGPPGFAYLDTAIGFGDMAIAVHETGPTDVTPTASFVIGLGYRIGDMWQIAVRFPISTGKSDGPLDPHFPGARNPDQYTQIALGSPEIGVTPYFTLSRRVRVPVGLAFTLPIGAGDEFPPPTERAKLGQAIVQQAAAASRGWEDRALFAYNRFGIIPSGGIMFQDNVGPGKLRVNGTMKFEMMVSTGGEDPPEEKDKKLQGRVRGVSFNWVTKGEVFYDLFDGLLSPGVKLWYAYATAHELKGSIDPGGSQFVFEPNIMTHLPFSDAKNVGIDGRLGYMIPLGGELGSGTFPSGIGGLRLTAGLFFGP